MAVLSELKCMYNMADVYFSTPSGDQFRQVNTLDGCCSYSTCPTVLTFVCTLYSIIQDTISADRYLLHMYTSMMYT